MAQLGYRVMDTQIFNLGLSLEANSAYIVVCSLMEDGLRAGLETVTARWNGTPETLAAALRELAAWRVVETRRDSGEDPFYAPNPASLWRQPGQPG